MSYSSLKSQPSKGLEMQQVPPKMYLSRWHMPVILAPEGRGKKISLCEASFVYV